MLRRYRSLRGEPPCGTVDPDAARRAAAEASEAVAREQFQTRATRSFARDVRARLEFDALMASLVSEDKRRNG